MRCPFPSTHFRWLTACVSAAACAVACAPDGTLPGYYAADDDAGADAAVSLPSGTNTETVSPGKDSTDAGSGQEGSTTAAPAGPCDLTGRWIVTAREVATAIGVKEAAHVYMYYEIKQTGDTVVVTKGLRCGQDARPLGPTGANVDYPKAWPSLQAHDVDTGRQGSSKATASGCQVAFNKQTTIAGATQSAYSDLTVTMPTASEKASGVTPGWEDWDQDGNPGYTLNVTGLAVGKIYVATRTLDTPSGPIAKNASTFTLPLVWSEETALLGYDGPSLLTATTSGTVDSDPSLHFTQFARLSASQATGDDTALCAAIRTLAPQLTPTAAN